MAVEPTADSATVDNTTACSNLAQSAEVKSTDVRKRFSARYVGRPHRTHFGLPGSDRS